MGGKHKQAQRIKNNARPSSSGRSAEMLASSSQMSSIKDFLFVPPAISLMKTEEFDQSVSPEFQLVFKKMNKKDSTTKIKALQEFSDLIVKTDMEIVKIILGYWSTLYGILATDTDHRVREATHNAHYQIAIKDKKMIAPFLKQLIGPWFTSQYDNYPSAASAASKAFNATFPPNKVQDCVIFCQKEILTYICDNLTMTFDPSKTSDFEAKFERITMTSLQGYCLYLETLTTEQIEKSTDLNHGIFSNECFVKLASHKSSVIRAAWFKVLATLYHKAPFLLQDKHNQFIPIIFNNMDESEPIVVGFVWDAILLIMDMNLEWYKYINIDRIFLSKLKKLLREGGHGNASVIYPNLLSILNKLPPTLSTESFYNTYFENLRNGLNKKSVLVSKSESGAIIASIIESLQYVILKNQGNSEFCQKLIKAHLLPLINWTLSNEQICYRTVFHHVALLIQYWNRNKTMEIYLNHFWSLLNLTDFNKESANRQIVFIQTLKQKAKVKQMKVTFEQEHVNNESHVTTDLSQSYYDNLIQLTYVTLMSYVRQIDDALLGHIHSLVTLFDSHSFLKNLTEKLNDTQNVFDIFTKIIQPWLLDSSLNNKEIIVDLSFILLKYVTNDEKSLILETLSSQEAKSFGSCVKTAFSHPYNKDGVVKVWLKSAKVGAFILTVVDANLKLECAPDLQNLFKLAFTESDDGQLLIDGNILVEIVRKLVQPLLTPASFLTDIDSCAHLAAYVNDTIYTENSLLKFGDDLLLALFKFSCGDHTDLEFLTDDTQFEIDSSWQGVISMLSKSVTKQELLDLTTKCAHLVEMVFLENSATNRIIENIVSFIRTVFIDKPLIITQVFQAFFDRPFLPMWREKIEFLAVNAEYLPGCLACIEDSVGLKSDISDEEIVRFFQWTFYKISVLNSTLDEENWEEEFEDDRSIVLTIDTNQDLVYGLIYDLTLGQSILQHYKMSQCFTSLSQIYEKSIEKLKNIIKSVTVDDVMTSKVSDSFFGVKTLYHYHYVLQNQKPLEIYLANYKKCQNTHLVQLCGQFLTFDDVDHTSSTFDSIIKLRALAHCDEIDVQIAEVFEMIKKQRSKNMDNFLFNNKNLDWYEAEFIIESIRTLSALIRQKFDSLNRQHWDFTVISLSSWATNCQKLRSNLDKPQNRAFIIAVTELFVTISQKMALVKSEQLQNSFVDEWEDLFLPNIHEELLQFWLYISEKFSTNMSISDYVFLQEFGRLTDYFVCKLIFLTVDNWGKILKRCCKLLVSSEMILQIWGYKMAKILINGLIDIDIQFDSSSTPNTKGFTIQQFKAILEDTHNVVDGLLTGFKLGDDSCQVAPFTDSYTYVFAYLLLWNIFLDMCEKSPPQLRYQYADWLKNDNYLKKLLNNLFKLMPTEILHCSETKIKSYMKLFVTEPALNFNEALTSEKLEQRVCWSYYICLSQLPALVRQWWSESDSKVAQMVERVTVIYVAPQLCTQELQDVGQRENNFKNMTVKIIPSVREVIAVYTVDEAQMELVITLPQNYPLGGPDVRCTKQIGGSLHKQWLMQLKKYLLHQNGRVWDGLALWKSSLDKKFDGVEECYICFAVLHPGSYQMPKLLCQTCKKKFHSVCLYKWFSTSNKSSCPICRNIF